MSRRYSARWVSLRSAARFVAAHHRHHDPPQGGIIALGLWDGEKMVGVGVLGRPVSRHLQEQGAVELIRLCVLPDLAPSGNHAAGAASALTARMRRLAQAMGFERLLTYTLPDESGSSLEADGWQADMDLVGGGEWTKPGRARSPATHPTGKKVRWWAPMKKQQEMEL